MPPTNSVQALGPGGWVVLAALVVGALTRALKGDTFSALLQKLGLPTIPKAALPWVALALGFLGGVLDAKVDGATWMAALQLGVWGVFAGGGAVAGNELAKPAMMAATPRAAKVLLGSSPPATPSTPPAPTPSPPSAPDQNVVGDS